MKTGDHNKPTVRERLMNWLAILVLLSLGIVWPAAFANTTDSSIEPGDLRAGSLLLKTSSEGRVAEALRQSTRMRAQVTGNVARVRVTQTFENPGGEWVEGLYVFPLPAGAAVDELEMTVGERRIVGEIKRKAEARATYERAKSEGRRASLVEQERPNMFTTSVSNIAPRSAVTVEIAYLDAVPFRDGRYTLNLPLSITPRYTPGVTLDPTSPYAGEVARAVNRYGESLQRADQPLHSSPTATPERVTSRVQNAQIEIDLNPGFPLGTIDSINHPISMSITQSGRRISLQGNSVPADRDFELVWTPAVQPDTHADAFAERVGDDTYALVMLMPPQIAAARAYRREVIFIIDTSGSMSGPSIEQARAALHLGVQRLAAGDTFNIIRFSNDAESLFPRPQLADTQARAFAARYIDSFVADGGTEMRSALELALSMPPTSEALRQIVFITDGSVSNEADLVKLIRTQIGSARLFTVGIGAAPNAWFMREAAAAGRGSYLFISQVEQVRARMEDLFRKLENPALVDLELHWPGGMKAELAASLPSDVYAGDPLVIAARLPGTPRGVLTLTGRSAGATWTRQLELKMAGKHSGIAKLWARERIAELTRQRHFGINPAGEEARITDLALRHHLVSDFTSLVAVEVTPARDVATELTRHQVPTSAPRGGAWARTTGFASTATSAPLWLLAGLFAIALAAVLWLTAGVAERSLQRMSGGLRRYRAAWHESSECLAGKAGRCLALRFRR